MGKSKGRGNGRGNGKGIGNDTHNDRGRVAAKKKTSSLFPELHASHKKTILINCVGLIR